MSVLLSLAGWKQAVLNFKRVESDLIDLTPDDVHALYSFCPFVKCGETYFGNTTKRTKGL